MAGRASRLAEDVGLAAACRRAANVVKDGGAKEAAQAFASLGNNGAPLPKSLDNVGREPGVYLRRARCEAYAQTRVKHTRRHVLTTKNVTYIIGFQRPLAWTFSTSGLRSH